MKRLTLTGNWQTEGGDSKVAFPTKEMIHLNSPICYFFWSFAGSLAVRSIQCIFRAWLPKSIAGEDSVCKNKKWEKMRFAEKYQEAFEGWDPKAGDHWLPCFVGIAELLAYPILFHFEQVAVIGGWIALKTAGRWTVWKDRQPAFYSFLLGNIFIIIISYFFMTTFINP